MEIPILLPIKARDPFLGIRKRMGPTVDLEIKKHIMTAEREAPTLGLTPRNTTPFQRGKGKNMSLVIEAISKIQKDTGLPSKEERERI